MRWCVKSIAGTAVVLLLANGASAQSQPPSAQDFAAAAAQSDAYEIDAARVAQLQAQDQNIRAFADQMIKDHMQTSQSFKAAVAKAGLPPPPDGPNADQARMLSALQSMKGTDFDKAYVVQQVVAHQGAVAVEQEYVDKGTEPNLKYAATTSLPLIRHHLAMARQLESGLSR